MQTVGRELQIGRIDTIISGKVLHGLKTGAVELVEVCIEFEDDETYLGNLLRKCMLMCGQSRCNLVLEHM